MRWLGEKRKLSMTGAECAFSVSHRVMATTVVSYDGIYYNKRSPMTWFGRKLFFSQRVLLYMDETVWLINIFRKVSIEYWLEHVWMFFGGTEQNMRACMSGMVATATANISFSEKTSKWQSEVTWHEAKRDGKIERKKKARALLGIVNETNIIGKIGM